MNVNVLAGIRETNRIVKEGDMGNSESLIYLCTEYCFINILLLCSWGGFRRKEKREMWNYYTEASDRITGVGLRQNPRT